MAELDISATTVRETLTHLEEAYPGILSYLTQEDGQLRKHVNIFVSGELIHDRVTMSDAINNNDELIIFQALSGG